MIRLERSQKVLAYLAENSILTAERAVEITQSSLATVRRDFAQMANDGLVRRVRGGIALMQLGPSDMLPIKLREIQHQAEKRALATIAASLLGPGDVVIIDGGTTDYDARGGHAGYPIAHHYELSRPRSTTGSPR